MNLISTKSQESQVIEDDIKRKCIDITVIYSQEGLKQLTSKEQSWCYFEHHIQT